MEFELKGHRYQIGRLNAFNQMNVARRLATALIPLANLRKDADKQPSDEEVARAFVTLTSQMPDELLTPAITSLLSTIKRDVGGDRGWASISTPDGMLMYSDIDGLTDLNILLIKALDANQIIDFFVDHRSASADQAVPEIG